MRRFWGLRLYSDAFIEYLEKNFDIILKDSLVEQINVSAKEIHFPAGYTILHEGERSQFLYFIVKGMVRGYYIDKNGNDITKCFSAEEEFCSTEGFRTSAASMFTIECLEDCTCIRICYSLIHSLLEMDTDLGTIIRQLFQSEVSKQEHRNKSLMLLSAEERYRVFGNEYPHLQERIALKYIASYIGIRPASLSRIRKQMSIKITCGDGIFN